MSERSAAELEREAEAARARMVETAHTLQHKMTPGQILDELGTYFRDSDGAIALHNLKTQVRDNPLPLALVGTGLAWLFMGGGPRSDRFTARRHLGHRDSEADTAWADTGGLPETGTAPIPASAQGHHSSMKERAGGALKSVSRAAGSLSDKLGSAYSSAGDKASAAAHSMAEGQRHARSSTGQAAHYVQHAGGQAQSMFRDTLQQEPLIIAALGIALGAALGAMLPRTQAEDEYVGPYEDRMRENLKETARQGLDSAKDVAAHAYQAGKEEAAARRNAGAHETASSERKPASGTTAKTADSPKSKGTG